ncbi:MAG: hypothetical protein ACLP2P_12110 [Desulfobaccales bacterium]
MKKVILLALCLMLIGAGAASATSLNGDIIYDQYNNSYTNPTIIGASPYYFLTSSYTFNNGVLTFNTNWNPGDNGEVNSKVTTAYLFIKQDGNTYAIDLNFNNLLNNTVTILKNPTIIYSNDSSFNFKAVGDYGEYYQTISTSTYVPVTASGGTSDGSATVQWSNDTKHHLGNTVTIDLGTLLTSDPWSFVWGTATCGNGTVYAFIPSSVPLPPSALLLGTGLLGLVGLGWRRRQTKV